jgi:hypothetical protein
MAVFGHPWSYIDLGVVDALAFIIGYAHNDFVSAFF